MPSHAGESVMIVYGAELGSYVFGEDHPLQPSRFVLTMRLLSDLGWLDCPGLTIEAPRPAGLSELLLAHSFAYVQSVQRAQAIARRLQPPTDLSVYSLGTEDNPLFPDIHDSAALYTGATVQAMTAVVEGKALHAYNPAGGEHHAQRARASGFCVYNDSVSAIAAALESGRRVAYLDLDAHHGDGVQAAFYEDPRVLTISIHESGEYLFPGTGSALETGRGEGLGTCVNVPLPANAGDEAVIQAFDRIATPAAHAFAPDILLVQTGADMHHTDPLTDLRATVSLYPELARRFHRLAHECCGGRLCVVGGGGYDPADVTPRAWASMLGVVLGHDVDDVVLPQSWIEASRAAGGDPPARLLDDDEPGPALLTGGDLETVLRQVEQGALATLVERCSSRVRAAHDPV